MLWGGISLALLAIAYLFGSIPTGYLLGRYWKGIDIREYGSGGTGATNVLRTLGKTAGITVLVIDILKGVLAILVVKWGAAMALTPMDAPVDGQIWLPWIVTLAGLAAILGHSRSIWINFTGGKSVATGLGVLTTMAWQVGLGAILVFAIAVAIWRIVSLGSILAAIAAIGLMIVTQQPLPYQLLAIAGGTYVIWRHQSNIQRLLKGTEPKLGQNLVREAQ